MPRAIEKHFLLIVKVSIYTHKATIRFLRQKVSSLWLQVRLDPRCAYCGSHGNPGSAEFIKATKCQATSGGWHPQIPICPTIQGQIMSDRAGCQGLLQGPNSLSPRIESRLGRCLQEWKGFSKIRFQQEKERATCLFP